MQTRNRPWLFITLAVVLAALPRATSAAICFMRIMRLRIFASWLALLWFVLSAQTIYATQIDIVEPDLIAHKLLILGSDFGTQEPVVTLGQTLLTIQSFNATSIIANLPSGLVVPGTYRLIVIKKIPIIPINDAAGMGTSASGDAAGVSDSATFAASATFSVSLGDTGLQGSKGDTGLQGSKGDTGLQGLKGDTGLQGPKGDTGLQGLKGDTGLQGSKGDTGLQGSKGDTGLQGSKGDTGLQGSKGDTGLQGLKGDTGLQGSKGDTGLQGPAGPQGPQGATGPQGPPGPKGDSFVSGCAKTENTASLDNNFYRVSTWTCLAGQQAMSGGYIVSADFPLY